MIDIEVHRYGKDDAKLSDGTGWLGYIEPKDRSWIMFIDTDHKPWVCLTRDPEFGACLD